MHTTILLYDNLSTKSCTASLHGFTLAFIYFYLHIQALQPNVGDNSKRNDSKRNIRNVAMSRVKIHIRKKLMKSPSFFIFLQIPTFLTMFFFIQALVGTKCKPPYCNCTVGCNVIPRCWSLQNKSFSIQIISDIQLDWIIYLIIIHYWRY